MFISRSAIWALGCAFVLIATPAGASPIFSINTLDEWQAALSPAASGGKVTPVTSAYTALGYYGTEGVDYQLVTPTLSALGSAQYDELELGAGLQMSWGDISEDVPQVAAWEYTYGEDPDLTGTVLSLTVTPPASTPPVILAVSLTLTDMNGGWMSWFWDTIPPAVGPTGVPSGVPTTITINPTLHANQANSTAFTDGGFDHKIAISIIADELAINPGTGGANWTSFPSAPLTTGVPVWNYWSGLSVTPIPVPAAFWLFGSALGLLGWLKRRTA